MGLRRLTDPCGDSREIIGQVEGVAVLVPADHLTPRVYAIGSPNMQFDVASQRVPLDLQIARRTGYDLRRCRIRSADCFQHPQRKRRVLERDGNAPVPVPSKIEAIDRDAHDSLPELFEIMVADYLEKYGGIDASLIPSEEELVERYLRKQDDKDGE